MTNNKVDADKLWNIAWTYIRTVVDTVREPFLFLDKNLTVLSANRTFYLFFKENKKDVEGRRVYDLGDGQWNIKNLRILLEDILPKNVFFEDFKVEHNFSKVGHRIMMLNARRVYAPDEERPMILLAMEDITKQVELEDKMKKYTKQLTLEVAKRTAELEKRVKELERMNKVMVGRELEMAKFKKQIKELEKKTGS